MNATVLSLPDAIQFADGGIVSKTLHSDPSVRIVLFCFDDGQMLTEHTAAVPAVLHVLEGEAALTLGEEAVVAGPGTVVHMDAHLPHSVEAKGRLTLLLHLLRQKG